MENVGSSFLSLHRAMLSKHDFPVQPREELGLPGVHDKGGRYWEDSHDHDPRRFRPACDRRLRRDRYARPAAAVTYRPWCVQYSGGSGNNGLTCAFSSFEQCMMTGGPGTGGSCVQNPWYLWYGEHGQGRVADDRRRPRRQ